MKLDYICVGGCGDFTLEQMKLHDDGTLICTTCGFCQWYLRPWTEAEEKK